MIRVVVYIFFLVLRVGCCCSCFYFIFCRLFGWSIFSENFYVSFLVCLIDGGIVTVRASYYGVDVDGVLLYLVYG